MFIMSVTVLKSYWIGPSNSTIKEVFKEGNGCRLNVHEMAFRYVPYLLVRKMEYFVFLGFVELKR